MQLPEQDNQQERPEVTEAYITDGLEQLEVHANNAVTPSPVENAPIPERPVHQIARELQTVTAYVAQIRGGYLK